LEQIILGGKWIQVCSNEGDCALLQREVIAKEYKYTEIFRNLLWNQQAKINET
jgi:hypothetical protein